MLAAKERVQAVEPVHIVIVRLLDAALITAWGFGVVIAVTRVAPLAEAADILFVVALVNGLLLSDLGMTQYVYSAVRRDYVARRCGDYSLAGQLVAFLTFLAILALVTTIVWSFRYSTATSQMLLVGLAAYVTFSLPRNIVGSVARALDRYLEYYWIEAGRKAASLAVLAAVAFRWLPPVVLPVGIGVLWLITGWRMARLVPEVSQSLTGMKSLLVPREVLRSGPRDAAAYSVLSFIFYQGPYVVIYPLFGPASLVLFDVFNKVRRAVVIVANISVDGFAPRLTHAYHTGSWLAYRRSVLAVTLVLILLLLPIVLGALLFWSPFVSVVTSGQVQLADASPLVIVLAIAAFAVNSSAVATLAVIGRFRRLLSPHLAEILLAVSATVFVACLRLDFSVWLALYAVISAIGAVYVAMMVTQSVRVRTRSE